MEINGQNFENISFSKAFDILRNNTHLSLTVKTNIFGEFGNTLMNRKHNLLQYQFKIRLIWRPTLFPLLLQSSKSSSAGLCTRRRTADLTSPRSRRKKGTASPSLTFLETWSSPRTTRAPGRWRPTPCQEDATRSGRCWRRRASASCRPNPSGRRLLQGLWIFT